MTELSGFEKVIGEVRRSALRTRRADINPFPADWEYSAYGIVMDMCAEEGKAMLLAFATGHAGLYSTRSGALIAGTENDQIRSAAVRFVAFADSFTRGAGALTLLPFESEFDFPEVGQTRIHVLTERGIRVGAASTVKLEGKQIPLAVLFQAGLTLAAALRGMPVQSPKK